MNNSRDIRQAIAVKKWFQNKCKGTLIQPTGCGKTKTALKALSKVFNKYPTVRILVVVPTDNLKQQWRVQLDDLGMQFNADAQVINSIIKHTWVTDILVLDEIHRYAASTFREVFNKVKYKYVLGLTATFNRLDGKHELIKQYCPIIDKITLQEAKLNHWVSSFKEYQVIIDVDNIEEYREYNKSFIASFEFFNFDWNLAMSRVGKVGYKSRLTYRDILCKNGTLEQKKETLKNITYHAMNFMRMIQKRKAFINNHPKKIEIARKIIEARSNSKIITFSNNIKMAEAIGMGGQVYTGKDSKKKARANLEEFNQAKTGIIHSVAKLDEGADIKGLSVAIILGLNSSEIKSTQRRGRCIRFEEGKTAEIFNIIINDTVESKWFASSHKNSTYITVDEQGLDDILNGREPKPYVKPIKDYQFRF